MQKIFAAVVALSMAFAFSAAAQTADVITVGTVSGVRGGNVDVPVYIRDISSTALGIDRPAGSRLQSYSLRVSYAPASSVSAITFSRAGVTAPLTPTFESSPSSAGAIALIDSFSEATNLIPFTLNAPAPGNLVGVLHVTISGVAPAGSTIALTLDPVLTQLANEAGTTTETTGAANLILVNGAVNVSSPTVPTLSPAFLAGLALAIMAGGALRLRRA